MSSRFLRILTPSILLLMLTTPALAGSQIAPEVTDASGDVNVTGGDGPLNVAFPADEDFGGIDLVGAWIEENATSLLITVETVEATLADATIALSFTVNKGPTSVFGSTANGTQTDLSVEGGVVTGPATFGQAGEFVTFTVARADVGASGGDIISDLVVSSSQTEAATCAVGCIATTGTDRAPDAGAGTNYTLSRPAVVAAGAVQFTGGSLNVNGTTQAITGTSVNTTFGNGTISWDTVLTNTGSDVDTFNVTLLTSGALAASGVVSDFTWANLSLSPGASHAFTVNATFANAPVATHGFALLIGSERGAIGATASTLIIKAVPVPDVEPPIEEEPVEEPAMEDARDPILAVGFLTSMAESTGMDDTFGDWAEIVLLALMILLLLVILFLLLAFAGGGWIKVSVSPRNISAAPGETAEFNVNVRNKKKRYTGALAYFDGDPDWQTGVLLEQDGRKRAVSRPGAETKLDLGSREDPDGEFDGTLRVQVPHDALDRESDRVVLNVVPLGQDGKPLPRKAGHAKVTVKASAAPAARAPLATPASTSVRLSNVKHDPADPAPETVVTTTATVENDSATKTARLRVVLQLEGEDTEEQIVEVPPHSARAVTFPWIAEDGSNKVRVQIYEA